jgi:hypothetical protein
MSEMELKIEAEVEDFTDELSDDRAEGAMCQPLCFRAMRPGS